MEYYSAIRHKGIRKFEGKEIELHKIILSEVTQYYKDKHDTLTHRWILTVK